MPKKVMDYSNTHFYKIVCKDLNIKDCYVGHTRNFAKRKRTHKNSSIHALNRNYNLTVYKFIRDNGGFTNFEMILINTEPCEHRLEALSKERQYKEQLKATLNQLNPYLTDEERLKKAETYNGWKREDRKNNPDKYTEFDKENMNRLVKQ